MRNLLLILATLLSLCVVIPTVADADIPTVSTSATDAASKAGAGITVGGHDAFLSEAPTMYWVPGQVSILRNVWTTGRDDRSYTKFGFLSGATAGGLTLDAGFSGTAALSNLVETGLRAGMNLDIWSDGSLVGVPHMKIKIQSLLPNSTMLYATVAYSAARMPSSQISIQASRLYGFVGMQQRLRFLNLGFAVGNRNTIRLGLTIKEIRVFGSNTTISPGVEFLRSPGRNSVALFVTSGAF